MLKKALFSLLFVMGIGVVLTTKAYAAVDISLNDTEETIEVVVNSNDSYITGVDMKIVFSEGMSIDSSEISEDMCTMGSKIYTMGGAVYIECFNSEDTEMSDVLATLTYSTEVEDYYFYVDQDSLDLGSLTLGEVTDINKPEIVVTEADETKETTGPEEAEDVSFWDSVITFLSDNSLYVLGGIGLLLVIVVIILGLTGREEKPVVQE